MNHLPEDVLLSILDYLNYRDLFHKEKTMLSKLFNVVGQRLLKEAKIKNKIAVNFLSLYWEKKELESIPIIFYRPNKINMTLKTRLFDIFDARKEHTRLFISNIFTNNLSLMIRPIDNEILFVEFLENKLNYYVYTRQKKH
jgi:hypothetical protein